MLFLCLPTIYVYHIITPDITLVLTHISMASDPHELASWVNEIRWLVRLIPIFIDPRELVSWVKEITQAKTCAAQT